MSERAGPALEIDPGLPLRIGVVAAEPVRAGPAGAGLNAALRASEHELRERFSGLPPADIEGLAPARALYRSFGIDPTKTRPSSEALLRRILRGQELPAIVDAVDLANLLAVRFLLPIGLYDAGRIEPPVRLRRGEPDEAYPGIRKEAVHLAGRPVLADRAGAFGNPTSDSARTAVGSGTCALWLVIFAPSDYSLERLGAHVRYAREQIERHLAHDGVAPRTSGAVHDAPPC